MKELEKLAEQGVEVDIDQLPGGDDVPAVHAGYQRRRRRLLLAGVKLFELPPNRRNASKRHETVLSSFGVSLHAKTVTADGNKVFVGSFNFDPRSAQINTESGIIIESEAMAMQINSMFDHELPMRTYEARLNRFYKLYWLDKSQIPAQKLYKEPGAGIGRRLTVWLTARLPVDHLL